MKRKDALAYMRIAGYHDDKARFTQLYMEHRISRPVADDAWREGVRAKANGMRCSCSDCNKRVLAACDIAAELAGIRSVAHLV